MGVTTNPQQAAQDWANQLAAKTDKIKRGVEAVTQSPGAAAARQQQVYVNNVQASAAKWARNVSRVSLNDWQQAVVNKGIPRVASGAQAAQPKMEAFFTRFLPAVAAAVNALPPRGTYEQNKARSIALMDALHKFGQSGQ